MKSACAVAAGPPASTSRLLLGRLALLLLLLDVATAAAADSYAFPKLVFLAPVDRDAEHVLNERSGLSGRLERGWLVKAEREHAFYVHVLTREPFQSADEVGAAYIFFTTEKTYCDAWRFAPATGDLRAQKKLQRNLIYRLDVLPERSRFHGAAPRLKKDVRSPRSPTSAAVHINTTLIVARVDLRLQHSSDGPYYACVHVSSSRQGAEQTPTNVSSLTFVHQGAANPLNQIITSKDMLPLYLVILFYLVLTCFSALFSGLNLGLMSLDLTELNILKKVGSKRNQHYAKKIYPLRQRGNLLLCTILLGNVMVNSTSTLILGSYVQGVLAAIGSTLIIVIFGEIIPQAVCTRYGLAVGAYTRFITYAVMGLTFVVSFPLSKVLDCVLGKETAASYSRDKVRELMRQAEALDIKDQQKNLISGALDFKNKIVANIMVPIKDVFALENDAILDFDTFKTILYNGYSRIPVYEKAKENLIGLILIQDLLLNDPADKVPLMAVLNYYKHQTPKCKRNDSLEVLFEKFRKGDTHMAFVYADDADLSAAPLDAVGIVTLENIIEALIEGEIMDEADFKRERRRKRAKELIRGKLANLSLSTENLNIFVTEDDQTNKPLISTQIRKALFYFLSSTVKPFGGEFVNPKQLEAFLRNPDLTREKRNLSNDDHRDENMFLYRHDVESDYFTIIIDGKALVQVGREGHHELEITAGLFSYYGVNALIDEQSEHCAADVLHNEQRRAKYRPEFSLYVDSYCVYLQIKAAAWLDLVRISEYGRSKRAASPTAASPLQESTSLSPSTPQAPPQPASSPKHHQASSSTPAGSESGGSVQSPSVVVATAAAVPAASADT